mmetsp:Transcript_58231/g.160984  ORF Transcript_58231/g.160984 Transcript_58231/m.160984 type:complete len:288 (+) Transcript_58231:78-941(+)
MRASVCALLAAAALPCEGAAGMTVVARAAPGGSAPACPDVLDAVYADMHDGDKKRVPIAGPSMTIRPSGNNETWEVGATVDPALCTASVDFRVPGKPSPPSVALAATLWTSFAVGPRGGLARKTVYEFTDPSGFLAPAAFPLNHWVQLGEAQGVPAPRGVEPCGAIMRSAGSAIYADMHDGDKKRVAIVGSSMTIAPSGNNQTWSVHASLDPKFCNASVDFNVPGKPGPPPVALTATLWSSVAPGAAGSVWKTFVEFTDPSGTLAAAGVPLNQWVQLGRTEAPPLVA